MSVLSWAEWLQNTPGSVAIRESTLLFPVIEGTHVLAIALSVGIIVLLDVRLLGWGLRRTPVSDVFEKLRPVALFGFGLMFLTGILLFWSEPVLCVTKFSFLVKLGLLALAGLNALIFDRLVYPSVGGWNTMALIPGRAQFAGGASLTLWLAVILCGRWTAYF
jgi:hypothetical protein